MVFSKEKDSGLGRRLAVIFAVAGASFCVLTALDFTAKLCVTTGCDLYKDWDVLGLSLWWWGAVGFGLIGGMALFSPPAALILAGGALVADLGLLVAMAFLAPCGNCLIAGFFFFMTWICLRGWDGRRGVIGALLTLLWFGAFTPNLVAMAGDGGGWPVYGDPADARMKVYFSPSCPACRRAVFDLTDNAPGMVAYIPVSEKPGDIERVIAMHKAVGEGEPFRKAFFDNVQMEFEPPELGLLEYWGYRLRIMSNHASFLAMGGSSVPVISMKGWAGVPRNRQALRNPGEPRPGAEASPGHDHENATTHQE